MITIRGLRKSYFGNEVLKGVDLTLSPGHVYGIMGHNGAGKTTLFNCIAGIEPYEGRIESPFSLLKNHLGYLMTDLYFFPMMTGREYLILCCAARGRSGIDFDARNIFHLPLDQYARTYSTGMKKKLALLAILLQDNDVFILDEAFNGLDLQSTLIVTEIVLELKRLKKTVLLSSHIFSTLQETCDLLYILEDGRCQRSYNKDAFSDLDRQLRVFGNEGIGMLGLK